MIPATESSKASRKEQVDRIFARVAVRKEERKEQAMDMFDLPIAQGKVKVDEVTPYGFAFITNFQENWKFLVDSFPNLYRISNNLIELHKSLKVVEGEESYLNFAFFIIDEDGFSSEIINEIFVPPQIMDLLEKTEETPRKYGSYIQSARLIRIDEVNVPNLFEDD